MQEHDNNIVVTPKRIPWNKGKLVGAKPPLRPKHVWSIRTKLQVQGRKRDLALFNLAIDSKLRGCDVVSVRVEDVAHAALPSIEQLCASKDILGNSDGNVELKDKRRHLRMCKPGQSGNPGGKSKKLEEIRSLAKDRSRRALERIIELVESDDEKVALMAAKEVLDRAWGKPTQTLETNVSFAGEFETFIRSLNERQTKTIEHVAGEHRDLD